MKNAFALSDATFARMMEFIDKGRFPYSPPNYPPCEAWEPMRGSAGILAAWKQTLNAPATRDTSALLYVHLPFCGSVCSFCGLNVRLFKGPGQVDAYLDDIEREAALLAPAFAGKDFFSLCIGGGTPSLLTPAQFRRLFSIVNKNFSFEKKRKFAIEANAQFLDAEKLAALKAGGVDWLSIGVQSLDQAVITRAGRLQAPGKVREVYLAARAAGIGHIQADLIFGLEGQTEASFLRDVKTLADWRVDRIHLYEFEPKARTGFAHRHGVVSLARRAEVRASIARGFDVLRREGYTIECDVYGVLIKTGAKAWPISYVRCDRSFTFSVLGLGVGSISYAHMNSRYQNTADLAEYSRRLAAGLLPAETGRPLSKEDEMIDFIIVSFMHAGQLSRREFARDFGEDPEVRFAGPIKSLEDSGVLKRRGDLYLIPDREKATNQVRKAFFDNRVVARIAEKMKAAQAPAGTRLYICGRGTMEKSHLTWQTADALKRCAVVFTDAAGDGDFIGYLKTLCPDVRVFPPFTSAARENAACETIASAAGSAGPVAYLAYGNPMLYSNLGPGLARRCRAAGLAYEALPAISFFDSAVTALETDLEEQDGLHIYSARRLLAGGLKLDPAVPTLLTQAGGAGQRGAAALARSLAAVYGPGYTVTVIRTPVSEGDCGERREVPLAGLAASDLKRDATLFLPPLLRRGAVRPGRAAAGKRAA